MESHVSVGLVPFHFGSSTHLRKSQDPKPEYKREAVHFLYCLVFPTKKASKKQVSYIVIVHTLCFLTPLPSTLLPIASIILHVLLSKKKLSEAWFIHPYFCSSFAFCQLTRKTKSNKMNDKNNTRTTNASLPPLRHRHACANY